MHVNGRRVNACLTFAAMHDGDRVVTVEGLGSADELHPMQAAFVEHDGYQCGVIRGSILALTAPPLTVRATSRLPAASGWVPAASPGVRSLAAKASASDVVVCEASISVSWGPSGRHGREAFSHWDAGASLVARISAVGFRELMRRPFAG